MIKELIVVEGKNDAQVIRRALGEVEVLWTEGYGLTEETLQYIVRAASRQGAIVLTDPDTAGEQIRQRIRRRAPAAKHVYLSKRLALKDGDIGVENASVAEIQRLFANIREDREGDGGGETAYTLTDLYAYGLAGTEDAAGKRRALGWKLGLGDTNAKKFLARLNRWGVPKEELERALEELDDGNRP